MIDTLKPGPRRRLTLVAFLSGLTAGAAAAPPAAGMVSRPLATRSAPAGPTRFTRLPSTTTEIRLVHTFPAQGAFELLQDQGGGAGVCIGDFDGDGLPDLFLTNYDQGNRLYRNLGNFHFLEVGENAGIRAPGRWCSGATAVDLDNDGDLDLVVAVFNGANLAFINRGDGIFDEQADKLGLAFAGASVSFAFEDYDRDGWLDAHLVTHRLAIGDESRLPRSSKESFSRGVIQVGEGRKLGINPAFSELFEIMSKGEGRSELIIAGQRDRLYRGLGQGRFEETSVPARLQGNEIGLASHWWDYDGDGWPDLYVSNDYKGPDRLFENHRDGTFVEVASAALPCTPWASMGSDSADVNNDGWMDLLATDMSGSSHERRMQIHVDEKEFWFLRMANPHQYARNALFLGTGTPRVLEASQMAGLSGTDWTWSPKFADFDNDGWVDLFVANGMARDFVNTDLLKRMKDRVNRSWLTTPVLKEANHAFKNLGGIQFESAAKAWGLDAPSASYGAAVADLDRDGDLDLVVMSFGEEPLVFRNDSAEGGRLLIRLKGVRSNSWGVGATVRIETEHGQQIRRVGLASGFMSANEPLVHFGLGEEKQIERLTVDWPSGRTQSFTHLQSDQFLIITEPSADQPKPPPPLTPATWFRPGNLLERAIHREQDFDEFSREPLLPWGLSRLGPGLACGDVTGDGLEDLYLPGAAGSAGSLWIQRPDHQFEERTVPAFQLDAASEDLGALFFDLDGDRDLDLYVVSGGVECAEGEAVLGDRLYLNDGHGHFTKAPEGTLPPDMDSGSVVAAADFDRDGDLDLFVGSRTIPGRYPNAGKNRLLRNQGGKLVDDTERSAPGVKETGMVTAALWSDVNDDGWVDLILAHEWGPIRVFLNHEGILQASPSGFDGTGWWTGLAAGDFDEDGDLDYVVANLGLNTAYRATLAEPALAFYGDYEGNGGSQFVEAYFEKGRLLPRRRLETLRASLPTPLARFTTVEAYGHATLAEVLGGAPSPKGRRLEMNTLETGILRNDGHGRFEFTPLPRLAQIAPVFGVVACDFDGDGHLDVGLAQNFSTGRPEVGAMNGGMSLILRGDGRGNFREVWPKEGGLSVTGDGRALGIVDLNGDHRPDLLVAQNNGPVLTFFNSIQTSNRTIEVRLEGAGGNPTGVGARLRWVREGARPQVVEIHAGDGYLSQSSSRVYIGCGSQNLPGHLEVRWPRGGTNRFAIPPGETRFTAKEDPNTSP